MSNVSLNPYFFGKCSTAGVIITQCNKDRQVLILIFLENALRLDECCTQRTKTSIVLILIFLENALRPTTTYVVAAAIGHSLNPYFFGKCSTALSSKAKTLARKKS